MWQRVESAVIAPVSQAEANSSAPTGGASKVVRRVGGGWVATCAAGIRVKVLHEDACQDIRTALYQMDPGSAYPSHVHGGAEECLVLSGDLQVGGVAMGLGDFQRVESGSRHGVQWTRDGCLLLITCSMSDQLE